MVSRSLGDGLDHLVPTAETVGIDSRYNWVLPLRKAEATSRKITQVWYVALPISSAHRGDHSGGGAVLPGVGGQERYANEGSVYPHASLVELITYQAACFPAISWRYIDLSHENWSNIREQIRSDPPDVAAFSVYSATAIWAYIVAAEIKVANPKAVIVFGNDHASYLFREILTGRYGSRLVDFIGLGNNGPFSMMGLLYALQGAMPLSQVPSLAYRTNNEVIAQEAPTFPLNARLMPDYSLIEDYMAAHYDRAFSVWYSDFYELKRMVTLPIDSGCHWGKEPGRRCRHCSIQGLTPKFGSIKRIVPTLEELLNRQRANVYCTGDSTLGFSENQWGGQYRFLNDLADAFADSPSLATQRFMLCYGLVREFLASAELCKSFVRTWNVGIEAFDPVLLRGDSKGVNKDKDTILRAFELARSLDYRVYVSGILGLPGTTLPQLRREVDNWLSLAEEFQDVIMTVSVSLPAVLPGSRMYWESVNSSSEFRSWHGELLPSLQMTKYYIQHNSEIAFADADAALVELGQGIIRISQNGGNALKFGGYMLGGKDDTEAAEVAIFDEVLARLP
jgi:radical SAM superfamily enzyme YgiQ (UPF0313 family)